jgi:uncharacterized protein YqeY
MKTVDEWKAILRTRLRAALVAKDKPALRVLRETLSAIENAEAPPGKAVTPADGPIAGSLAGLGAGEVERLVLPPEAVSAIVERELRERREAAAEYARLGRQDEADTLAAEADVLAAIAAEG